MSKSTGDVFRDLGFSPQESEDLRLRSDLLMHVQKRIGILGEPQSVVAQRLGITQPRVSDLLRGKLHLFSFETLTGLLRKLGSDVSVTVTDSHLEAGVTRTAVWSTALVDQLCAALRQSAKDVEQIHAADTQLGLAA
jgi:predicted XRE-type DNA-binding protein